MTSRFVFPLVIFHIASLFCHADLVDPAPHVEMKVNWRIGCMRADPTANLVYIVNETSDQILALDTETGTVVETVDVPDAVRNGKIEFSIDGSVLYLSTPFSQRLHSYSTQTLSHIASVSLSLPVTSFVIGSDGFLYTVGDGYGWDKLVKVDVSTGAEVDSDVSSNWSANSTLIRNSTGTRIFMMRRGVSGGSGAVHEVQVQNNAMPSYVGVYYNSSSNDKDLSFDDGLNTLYRASGGVYGLGVWQVVNSIYLYWAFDAPYGVAVGNRSGAPDVFGASGSSSDGRIRRFNKSTGATMHDYLITGSGSGFDNGEVMDGALEVTPNGHVVYGKTSGFSSSLTHYIGLIGGSNLMIPDVLESTGLPHHEVMTTWQVGSTLGDPTRNLVYIVDETNSKLIALDSDTGATVADVTIPIAPDDGELALSPDGSTLYLSAPLSARLLRFSAGSSPAYLGEVSLPYVAHYFVIGSDGYFYGIDTASDKLEKVDLATGSRMGAVATPTFYGTPLIKRNSTGSTIYVLERGLSGGSAAVDVFDVVANDVPTYNGAIFGSKSNDQDLSIDESRNLVFRNAGGVYGMSVWNLANSGQSFWPYDDAYGTAVAQIPSLPDVFGASGSDVIRQFEKNTGKTVHTYDHTDPASGFFSADVISAGLEMAANGTVVYGKYEWSDEEYFLGVIGTDNLAPPRSAPMRPQSLTATRGAYFDRILLDWDLVPGATSYEIYRATYDIGTPFSSSTPLITVGASSDSYTDFGVQNNYVYRYWVKAVNAFGKSQFSPRASGNIPNGSVPDIPENVLSTNGVYTDRVKVTWDYSERASRYSVYRNTIDAVGTASQVASNLSSEEWEDTTANPGIFYYYWVRAGNNTGNSAASDSDFGFVRSVNPPDAPSGLTATDSLFPNKVSLVWNSTSNTDSYSVFRNTSDSTVGATEIATGLTATSYDDTSVTPDVVYYYWVVAVNVGGSSPFSASDQGNAISPPPAPANVTATDGTFPDKVDLSWNASSAADSYTVYRSTANNPNGAPQIAVGLSVASYSDTGVIASTQYYYWVKAFNSGGASPFSFVNPGHAGILPPAIPSGVSATDGIHPDRIAVSWSAVSGADTYNVYRAIVNSSGASQLVASNLSGTSWDDTSYVKGTIYYYWVVAENVAGTSGFSASNNGYVIQYADTPTGVSASDALYASHVRVSWSAANHAERYYIYRALPGGNVNLIDNVDSSSNSYWDYNGAAGTAYEYHVTAWTATGGQTSPSTADMGSRRLEMPTNLTATDGFYQNQVRLTWSGVGGTAVYNIYRGTQSDGSDMVQIGTSSAVNYTDSTGNPGESYYYFVSSQNGANVSEMSSGETGYGTVGLPFRPDGMIGKSVAQRKGDNIYVMGKSQEYRLISKRGKRLRWYVRLENDGETEDTFSSLLTRKNGFFNGQLFDYATGANVTAAANVGSLTRTLAGGASQVYRLDVKPSKKTRGKKKKKIFSLTSRSGNSPGLMDGVRAKAETKK